MKIAIDGGCFGVDSRYRFGVHRFGKNFIINLAKRDKKNQYFVYSLYPLEGDVKRKLGDNFTNVVFKPKRGFQKLWLPFSFTLNKYSHYVGISQSIPWFHPFKSIVFIHDLAFERHPDCFADSYEKLSAQTKKAALESDRIIVFSEQTKKDIINFYRAEEDKIKVVKQGIDPVFRLQSREKVKRVLSRYKIPDKYFLYVGDLKKIKNVKFLVRGFSEFIKKEKEKVFLVLVGGSLDDGGIEKVIEKEDVGKYVIRLGFVPDGDLAAIYSGAIAFTTASLYEGFGHPALEAASCGCLVAVSDIAVHRENLGSDAVYFKLDNKEKLRLSLSGVYRMSEEERERQKKALLARVKRFNWKELVLEFLRFVNEDSNSTG